MFHIFMERVVRIIYTRVRLSSWQLMARCSTRCAGKTKKYDPNLVYILVSQRSAWFGFLFLLGGLQLDYRPFWVGKLFGFDGTHIVADAHRAVFEPYIPVGTRLLPPNVLLCSRHLGKIPG